MILYEDFSAFDNYTQEDFKNGKAPLATETPDGLIDIGGFEAPAEPKPSRSPSAESTNFQGPACGQNCAGPVNLCSGSDGCRCIADPWQGTGSGFFTGSCRTPYYDSGRELAEIDSIEAVDVTDLPGVACPCNCTYVSKACCSAGAGIVQEAPALRLGAVRPPAGQSCNSSTGQLQPEPASLNPNLTSRNWSV